MMAEVYIGVGSNIDPEKNIPAALKLLNERVDIKAVSTFYSSPPLGSPDSPIFYNGVVRVDTNIEPLDLKCEVLRKIEEALGRIRTADKCAPRTSDLDIILYEDQVIDRPSLKLPDPDITSRAFIAIPLLELDPNLILPGSGIRLSEIVSNMSCDSLTPLTEFTHALRKEILNE